MPRAWSSSRRISPGCTGRMPFLGVTVFSLLSVSDSPRSRRHAARRKPSGTDPPLRVDPDVVLPGPVSPERLQPVARQAGQVIESVRGVRQREPAHGLLGETPGTSGHAPPRRIAACFRSLKLRTTGAFQRYTQVIKIAGHEPPDAMAVPARVVPVERERSRSPWESVGIDHQIRTPKGAPCPTSLS